MFCHFSPALTLGQTSFSWLKMEQWMQSEDELLEALV